jgi:hypothetical protein
MFYLIETKNQLNQLKDKLSCSDLPYLEFIQGNDNTHPALAEIIATQLKHTNGIIENSHILK